MSRYLFSLLLGSSVALAGAGPAAGTVFRLEIGHPVAAGSATKKAVLVVRPLACDPALARITAAAEGLVNGSRRSIALHVQALPTPGVHAISRQWPDGRWVLNLTGTCAERNATAGALVPLSAAGFDREKIQILTREATGEEIETALRGAPAVAQVAR